MKKTEWKVVFKKIAKFYAKMFVFIFAAIVIIVLLIYVYIYQSSRILYKTKDKLTADFNIKDELYSSMSVLTFDAEIKNKQEKYNQNINKFKDLNFNPLDFFENADDYFYDCFKNNGFFNQKRNFINKFCLDKTDKQNQIYILYNANAKKLFIIQGY